MEKHAEVGAPPEAAPLEGSTVEGARWGSMPRFPAKSSTARSEALLTPPCRAARRSAPPRAASQHHQVRRTVETFPKVSKPGCPA